MRTLHATVLVLGFLRPSGIAQLDPSIPRRYHPVVPLGRQQKPLLLFGGRDHKTFLGCLTCSQFETNSVLNENGPHGNTYSTESIFNHLSAFDSTFSDKSACSEYANDPPGIVDDAGRFYGTLTVNQFAPKRNTSENAAQLLRKACETH